MISKILLIVAACVLFAASAFVPHLAAASAPLAPPTAYAAHLPVLALAAAPLAVVSAGDIAAVLAAFVLATFLWLYVFRAAWVPEIPADEAALKAKVAALEQTIVSRFDAIEQRLFPAKSPAAPAAAAPAAPAATPPASGS